MKKVLLTGPIHNEPIKKLGEIHELRLQKTIILL